MGFIPSMVIHETQEQPNSVFNQVLSSASRGTQNELCLWSNQHIKSFSLAQLLYIQQQSDRDFPGNSPFLKKDFLNLLHPVNSKTDSEKLSDTRRELTMFFPDLGIRLDHALEPHFWYIFKSSQFSSPPYCTRGNRHKNKNAAGNYRAARFCAASCMYTMQISLWATLFICK